MRKTLTAVVFLFLALALTAVPASAQSTQCLSAPAQGQSFTQTTFTLGICHNQKDAAGAPTVILAFKCFLNGASTPAFTWSTTNPAGLAPLVGVPDANGNYYFETPPANLMSITQKGALSLVCTATDADAESSASNPFSFSRKGPGASAPKDPRVK